MRMPFLLRDLAVGLRPDDKVPVIGQDAIRQDADGVSVVGFDHDVLERLEVGVLAQEVHPAHRSVQGMVHLPILCFSRGSWYREQGTKERRPPPILAASPFPLRPRFRSKR